MKKIDARLISFLALFLIVIIGCERESIDRTQPNFIENRNAIVVNENAMIQDGRFVFDSISNFEEFMHYLESINVDSLLQTLPPYAFQSLYYTSNVPFNGEDLDEPALE